MGTNFGVALLLTAAAGLSTTLGSLLGLVVKKPGTRFLSFVLGFSAGVMIMLSFIELLQGSIEYIGFLPANVGFFAGILSMFLVDHLVPHEYIGQQDFGRAESNGKLLRAGLLVALGIGIHNFPEGMATFAGALKDLRLGIAISIAIALHNIPEGLAVSVPVYAATGDRGKAFLWSFLSGAAEPVGAAMAAAVLLPFLTWSVLGWILAAIAGIMVFISLDELIPLSRSMGQEHVPLLGIVVGMVTMVLSLWMLK